VTGGGAYTLDLVGGDAHADAGAAHQDAALDAALGHGLGHLKREIRVVHALAAVRAEVQHLVAHLLQQGADALLDVVTAVVTADGDSHGTPSDEKGPALRAVQLRQQFLQATGDLAGAGAVDLAVAADRVGDVA